MLPRDASFICDSYRKLNTNFKMNSPSEDIFDFYSSLSEEQQESLAFKWSEDPASAVDEAITISKTSGYTFDRDVLEATVKALLDEDSDVDVELSDEVMIAVAGGSKKPWGGSNKDYERRENERRKKKPRRSRSSKRNTKSNPYFNKR